MELGLKSKKEKKDLKVRHYNEVSVIWVKKKQQNYSKLYIPITFIRRLLKFMKNLSFYLNTV